jgi:hypothetical protein
VVELQDEFKPQYCKKKKKWTEQRNQSLLSAHCVPVECFIYDASYNCQYCFTDKDIVGSERSEGLLKVTQLMSRIVMMWTQVL